MRRPLSTGRGRARRTPRAERSTPLRCSRMSPSWRSRSPDGTSAPTARPHLPLDPPSAAVPRPSEHPGGRHAAAGARRQRRVPLPGGCIRERGRRRSGRVDLPRPTRGLERRARPARRRRAGAIRARPQRGRGAIGPAPGRAPGAQRRGPAESAGRGRRRGRRGPTGARRGALPAAGAGARGRGSPPSDRGRGRRT